MPAHGGGGGGGGAVNLGRTRGTTSPRARCCHAGQQQWQQQQQGAVHLNRWDGCEGPRVCCGRSKRQQQLRMLGCQKVVCPACITDIAGASLTVLLLLLLWRRCGIGM
jgi:hypothetical protein